MAPVQQELEINLAQRLASNEKSIRSKALKTLRKYINLRSQKIEGGFTAEDLLKIWKGLFYCLWMQDKPLMQEEISHTISGLIHRFHTTDNQLLYFATFLQTVKREWNGIDRLRMDKFFQLVRFMFRQVFEILKRREWEFSVVNQFLQIFTKQLLQNTEHVPKGLMLHILDLYMNELAQVGSAELTAEQNLTFIDPFCKTMAKTKDRLLLTFISKNIFRTIVDHAPYAIEDLMRELQHAGGDDSDSDQASSEVEEEEIVKKGELKNMAPKETKVKKVNGTPEVVEDSKGSKGDLDLDSMDTEENDVGPVLQDNCDLSDRSDEELFDDKKSEKKKRRNESPRTGDEMVAKKSKACQDKEKPCALLSQPTKNLKKTKKGFEENKEFTDTDKAMDTSHIPLETGGTPREQDLRKKGVVDGQLKFSEIADHETVSQCMESDSQHHLEAGISLKKRRRSKVLKKISKNLREGTHEFHLNLKESEGEPHTDVCEEAVMKQTSFKPMSGIRCTETSTDINALGQSYANHKPEMTSHLAGSVETQQAKCGIFLTQEKTKNKKKKMMSVVEKMNPEISGLILENTSEEISLQSQLETSAVAFYKEHNAREKFRKQCTPQKVDKDDNAAQTQLGTSASQKKVKRKKLKSSSEEEAIRSILEDTNQHNNDEISRHSYPTSEEDCATQSRLMARATKKKKGKGKQTFSNQEDLKAENQSATTWKKNKILKQQESQPVEETKENPIFENAANENAESVVPDHSTEMNSVTPMKNGKKKRKLQTDEAVMSQNNEHVGNEMGGKKYKIRGIVTHKKLKMGKASPKSDFVSFQGLIKPPTPLFCKTKPKHSTPLTSIKKFQTLKTENKKVTFGLKNNKTTEFKKTDRSLLVSPVGSSRVAFDPKKMPMSGVLKSTSLSPVLTVKNKPAAKKRATAADFF
ncbi:ribosomal RNA processing protein 1-like A-like [Silurus meridionalis]|nr:ribosomal RNA processing protein 1-like A-like [Silurus meridionalis]